MDQFVEILKYLSAGLAVIAPLFKLLPARAVQRPKEVEELYSRIKAFFEEGGVDRHPLLVEASFSAAIGHTKLNAVEIPLVLRQQRPTQFIDTYIRVRSHISPTDDGSKFKLGTIASINWLRNSLAFLGVLLYVAFLLAALWLVFYAAPTLAVAQSWSNFIGALSFALLFTAAGFYCLVASSHLSWAKRLVASQR